MKVFEILERYNSIDRKISEINEALIEIQHEEPIKILERELDNYYQQLEIFLQSDFEPEYPTISITVEKINAIPLGQAQQIRVVGTRADGTPIDLSKAHRTVMLFRDFDRIHNNIGNIVTISVQDYLGEDTTLTIIRTHTGFDVDDSKGTQGLQVIPISDGLDNTYKIVDANGNDIGIEFVTDGHEEVGDNWRVDVYKVSTGTTYHTSDPSILTVTEDGLVTGVNQGSATIQINNGQFNETLEIEVV